MVSVATGGVAAVVTAVGLFAVLLVGGNTAGFEDEPSARIEHVSETDGEAASVSAMPARTRSSGPFDETRLSGTVTDENGTPIFRAVVTVDGGSRETTTNTDGFYSLELEPGEHNVTVSADGFTAETWTENLSEGAWTRTDVALSRAPPELTGTVTGSDGQPVENATVRVAETGDEATTDANGSFRFDTDAGDYTLRTTADGYRTRTINADVAEYGTTAVTVQLATASEDASGGDDGDEDSDSTGDTDGDERGGGESADEPDDGDGNGEDAERSEQSPDGASSQSDPLTASELGRAALGYAVLFLGTLTAAVTAGLYWNRSQRP